jgi:hypothetical protein
MHTPVARFQRYPVQIKLLYEPKKCLHAPVRCAVVLTCAVAIVLGSVTSRGGYLALSPVDKRLEQALEEINRAKEISIDNAYLQLFRTVDSKGLHKLLAFDNDSIALQCAWEEVRTDLPAKDRGNVPPLRLDAERLQRFLGFLEGRLRLSCPDWWQDLILNAHAHNKSNIYFMRKGTDWYHSTREGWLAPQNTSFEIAEKEIIVRVGSESVVIPRAAVEPTLKLHRPPNVSAVVTTKECVCAISDEMPSCADVFCFDKDRPGLRWKAKTWHVGAYGGSGGRTWHWMSLVVQNARVFLFGGGQNAVYIEAFELSTGKNLLRFSSDRGQPDLD